jgi:hypothetical protein
MLVLIQIHLVLEYREVIGQYLIYINYQFISKFMDHLLKIFIDDY